MARKRFRGPRSARHQLRRDQINRLLPNALTMLGLCAGLTAIRFGLEERWALGVVLIAGAALLDTLDGRIARLMGGPTEFGGQLDSLVDAISFGVAPVMLIFMWSLDKAGGPGWAISVLFVVCCVLRLARFNVTSHDPDLPAWAGSYFSGVPAPAGAGLVLLPLILGAKFEWDFLGSPWVTAVWTLMTATLMISRLPTYSFKRIRVPQKYVRMAMAGIAVLAVAMFTEPLITLSGIIIVYASTLPFAYRSFNRLKSETPAPVAPDDPDDEPTAEL
ncbi:MAG: phosphatidylcholine/phosphatidylserine synthase [Rhodospirillaceae bacterium]|jgi:CDP-diacylglycerol---serine O-phosphatidyltransferase|nr:phosphatidylcholine/phosphatidylserine synthase [Rhodospirillaceae bacterium]MBT5458804.1 phosphatidylcholine/phosphatidylserine synthase [Rhodospirillaceae bacterium]